MLDDLSELACNLTSVLPIAYASAFALICVQQFVLKCVLTCVLAGIKSGMCFGQKVKGTLTTAQPEPPHVQSTPHRRQARRRGRRKDRVVTEATGGSTGLETFT